MRTGVVLLCAAAAAWPAGAENRCEEPPAGGGLVVLVLDSPPNGKWAEQCRRLVEYLELPPAPFPEEAAGPVARLLLETGYFETAECELESEGTVVRCALTPQRMVYRFDIGKGVPYGLLEDDLARRVFLRSGTLLENEAESLTRQRQRLEDYLEREGYFGSKVTIESETVSAVHPNAGVRLWATVDAGPTVKLRPPILEGELPPGLQEREIDRALRHYVLLRWLPERFRPARYEDDLESLTTELRRLGYPEAEVFGTYDLDLEVKEAQPKITVRLGPRLELVFEGNRAIGRGKLAELTTFEESGVVDEIEFQASADAIYAEYQQRGFYRPKIEVVPDRSDPGRLVLTFRIDEGPRGKVKNVRFEGNEALATKEILRSLELRLQDSGLFFPARWVDVYAAADARTIKELYKSRGYAAAKVSIARVELDPESLEVVYAVEEGPRRMVAQMTMEGLPEDIDNKKLLTRLDLVTGAPYVHASLASDRREILATLNAAGYARGVVKRDLERPKPSEGGEVTIHYRIDAGPKSRFAGVLVRGNFRTVRDLIDDEISLDRGDDLDIFTLAAARRRLRALGPLASVDLVPLGAWRESDRTWLLVEVQERNARTFDLVFAGSTNDGFSLGADYRDRNVFGRAVRLDARGRAGHVIGKLGLPQVGKADSVDVSLQAPRPFGAPFDLQGSAYYSFRVDDGLTEERLGIGAGLLRQLLSRTECSWCPDVRGTFRYEVVTATTTERANVGRLVPALNIDRRDSFLDPRTGYAASLRFELANADLTPIVKGESFWRVVLAAQGYVTLGSPLQTRVSEGQVLGGPLVLALGATYGISEPYGATTALPESEGFFYGGDTSVRGLKNRASVEAFPGAELLVAGSVELRWYVLQSVAFGSIQLALFSDFGTLAFQSGDLFRDVTVSGGAALRYVTPVGPLSLAYGRLLVVSPALDTAIADLPRGRWHLTFGYSF